MHARTTLLFVVLLLVCLATAAPTAAQRRELRQYKMRRGENANAVRDEDWWPHKPSKKWQDNAARATAA